MSTWDELTVKAPSAASSWDDLTDPVAAPAPTEPRETTWGEFAGGLGLDLGIGTMRAAKSIPDLASFVLPDAWTDPWSELFERGIESAEAVKPEAYKEQAKQTFIERDEQGGMAGFQLPSAEALVGTGIQSLPYVPFFLAGGQGTASILRMFKGLKDAGKGAEIFGYGLTNAGMVAPDQWRQTYKEAIEQGAPEEEARAAANYAANMTAALTQATGSAGGAVAQRLGAESGNLAKAIAKGFVGEAPFEGAEEAGQEAIGDIAVGKPVDPVAMLDVGLLAGAAGGAPGAGVAGLEYLAKPPAQSVPEAPPPTAPDPVAEIERALTDAVAANEARNLPDIPQPIVEETPPTMTAGSPIVQAMQQAERQIEVEQEQAPVQEPTEAPISKAEPNPDAFFEDEAVQQAKNQSYGSRETLVYMSPDEFLSLAERIAEPEKSKTKTVDTVLKEGKKFNSIPFLGFENQGGGIAKVDQHEGRHRAMAFKRMGIKKMPVRLVSLEGGDGPAIRWQKQEEGQFDRIAAKDWPTILRGETEGEVVFPLVRDENGKIQPRAEQQTILDELVNAFGTQEKTPSPEPTAAEQAKTAERNRLGEDEVAPESGPGELFAGNEPGVRPTQNALFTEEGAQAARDRLKSKVGTVRSGVDPEMLADMAYLTGYHIEKGARTFAAYSKAMIDDVGEWVRPHLAKLWEDHQAQTGQAPRQRTTPQQPEPGTTSTKNAVTAAEREARNADPIFFEFRESNEELVGRAEQKLKDNPDIAEEIIERYVTEADPSISRLDLAILMVHKTDVRRQMQQAGQRMMDGRIGDAERAVAQAKYEDAAATNERIDQASVIGGAVWGGWGQLRSKMIAEDYSLSSQLARSVAMNGAPLDEQQQAFVKRLTDRIANLEAQLAENERTQQEKIEKAVAAEVMRKLAQQMDQQARAKQKKTPKRRLKDARNAEIEWLKAHSAQLNALPVEHVYHLTKLGGIIMAEGVVEFAAWAQRLKKYIGAKLFGMIEKNLDEIYALSQDEYAKTEAEVLESTIDDLTIEAEALAETDEPITHRIVYKLAEAFVRQGIRGEAEVMQAVHQTLREFYPDLTERDVRRLFTEYGKAKFPSQEEDKKTLRELRVLVRLQESIDRLNENLAPLRTGPQRDKATQKVREKQRVLNDLMRRMERNNPNRTRRSLASIDQTRIRRLENQIADLEQQIRTGEKPTARTPVPDSEAVAKLKKKRDALKKHLADIEAAKKPQLSPEEKYNELRGKQLRRQLAEVARRLRENDYGPKPRKVMPTLSQENLDLKDQIQQAKMELGEKQLDWARRQFTWRQKVWDGVKQFTSLVRAIKTSYDLSAVLRQGGFYVLSHPRTAIKSFIPMLKALRSDKFARQINDEILSRPNAHLYKKAKLFLAEQDSAHPTKMEEVYMSRWQKKVPGVPLSARAYVTFLNKLRADVFDATYESLTRKGVGLTEEELLDLGDFINNATGRADLGTMNSELMSTIFFAPRWVVSRFNMLLYPLKVAGVFSGKTKKTAISKRLRAKIAWEYFNFIAGFVGLWSLTALLFGDDDDEHDVIQWDARSTDFGKVRVGDTRMDVTAGLSNAIVFTVRTILGSTMSQRGEIQDLTLVEDNIPWGRGTWGEMAWRFLRSKLAPIPSSIINAQSGENVVGENYAAGVEIMQEYGIPKEIAESRFGNYVQEVGGYAVPLSVADFYDAAIAHGVPKAAALQILATLGVSMNTYSIEQQKKETGRPERQTRASSRPKRPSRD